MKVKFKSPFRPLMSKGGLRMFMLLYLYTDKESFTYETWNSNDKLTFSKYVQGSLFLHSSA